MPRNYLWKDPTEILEKWNFREYRNPVHAASSEILEFCVLVRSKANPRVLRPTNPPPEASKYSVLVIFCSFLVHQAHPRKAAARPRLIFSGYRCLPSKDVACVPLVQKESVVATVCKPARRRHGREGTMKRQLRWNSASARSANALQPLLVARIAVHRRRWYAVS